MHPRILLALGNFFIAISATLVSYTLLSYLSPFISESSIGLGIAAGAVVALASFFFLPTLVGRYGAQKMVLFLSFVAMVMLFAIATLPSTIASAILVLLVLSIQPLLYYGLDLLLEATIDNEGTTGRAHTFFLTGGNLGSFVAPLLIGTLLANTDNYTYVFFTAGAFMVPLIVLFTERRLPKGVQPRLSHFRETFKHLSHDRDLTAVTVAHFVLYLFYIWAPLYVPLYLHGTLGFPWATLGWMFSIMLIPYILIEYPAGWIADRLIGDKELMFAGFLFAGISLMSIGFLSSTSSITTIVLALVGTRAGAALIESMTEGHFFRRVSERNIVSVSVFRGVWPLANIIAPILGTLIFFIDGYRLFFVITGAIVAIAGVGATARIKDFK